MAVHATCELIPSLNISQGSVQSESPSFTFSLLFATCFGFPLWMRLPEKPLDVFQSTKHGSTLSYHPSPDTAGWKNICNAWTPVLFMLWMRCWLAIPAPPPPWLRNAGCPHVPTTWSFPLISAVFMLSSSWTYCSLASWTYPRDSEWWWLEQRSVTWGWWTRDSWISHSPLYTSISLFVRGDTQTHLLLSLIILCL